MNRDFLEMIKTRRSTRSFKSDSIPEDLLDAVLEAGTYAPTGMNRQSPVIIAVSDKKYREKLSKLNAAIMGVDTHITARRPLFSCSRIRAQTHLLRTAAACSKI